MKTIFLNTIQDSPKDESSVVKAVQDVHAMIDKEIAAGTDPNNVFVCGFSQGGLPLAHLSPPPSISSPNTHTNVHVHVHTWQNIFVNMH